MRLRKNLALKQAIFAAGTQRQIARTVGISESILSQIVRGRVVPTDTEQLKIANAVGRTVEELF